MRTNKGGQLILSWPEPDWSYLIFLRACSGRTGHRTSTHRTQYRQGYCTCQHRRLSRQTRPATLQRQSSSHLPPCFWFTRPTRTGEAKMPRHVFEPKLSEKTKEKHIGKHTVPLGGTVCILSTLFLSFVNIINRIVNLMTTKAAPEEIMTTVMWRPSTATLSHSDKILKVISKVTKG